jgi:hypothetical protein
MTTTYTDIEWDYTLNGNDPETGYGWTLHVSVTPPSQSLSEAEPTPTLDDINYAMQAFGTALSSRSPVTSGNLQTKATGDADWTYTP